MPDEIYQLPPSVGVSNTLRQQWWQIMVAVLRIIPALLRGDLQRAAEEVWVVKRESETLHRILSGRGVDMAMARSEVPK